MTLKVFGSRVLVALKPVESTMVGRVIIPHAHKEPTRCGTVMAVGQDCKVVVPGDKIFISFYAGTGIDFLGTEYAYDTHRVVDEGEILGSYEI